VAKAFPKLIGEVSTDWLSEVFDAEVTGFDKSFLPGGVLSDAYKLDIGYADGSTSAPKSAVIKLATEIDKQRDMATSNGAYLKELRFFQEFAEGVPIRVPDVYAIADDGSPDAEYFVILMEDLSTHSTVFDQLNDPPDGPFVQKFCMDVAELHGSFWESDRLTEEWIGSSDGRYVFTLESLCRECPENLEEFRRQWQRLYGVDVFDVPDAPTALALTETLAGPKSIAILDYISEVLNQRPRTLMHGDLRADNIFRTTNKNAEDAELTFIDWQLICAGPPGPDFTQAWGHTLPPTLRRKDMAFLKGYHDHLVEVSPATEAYTYEMLIEDYRYGYLLYWMAIISALATSLPGIEGSDDGERMHALYKQVVYYMLIAMEDHGCGDMLNRITAEVS